jgi:hypothetical protein
MPAATDGELPRKKLSYLIFSNLLWSCLILAQTYFVTVLLRHRKQYHRLISMFRGRCENRMHESNPNLPRREPS